MTDGARIDPYDPTGNDPALPTDDSGWPAADEPSGDARVTSGIIAIRSPGLGRFALILAVLVGTIVVSIILGTLGAAYTSDQTSTSFDYNLSGDSAGDRALAVATGWQYLIGTILGVWAIVQGIVAIAKNRGRLFGVIAIVIAAAGPILSLVVTLAAASEHLPR